MKLNNGRLLYSILILTGSLLCTGLTGCAERNAEFLEEASAEGWDSEKAEGGTETETGKESGNPSKEVKPAEKAGDAGGEAVTAESGAAADSKAVAAEQQSIFVDVCGAVVHPGVFELEAGSRVFQAIEEAGGYLPEAAQSYVNRAQGLEDGQQIYVPTKEELESQGIPEQAVQAGVSGQIKGTEEAGQKAGEDSSQGKVNLNLADETQLTSLSGIGAAKAQAIIAYREEHGAFGAIEEIMNVQGIKEGTFAGIKDDIEVG